MLTVARIHLLTALLFVAGLLDAGASIPKTRVGDFFDRAPVLTATASLQVAETHLENLSLYDWNASGSTLWTHFDPEGLNATWGGNNWFADWVLPDPVGEYRAASAGAAKLFSSNAGGAERASGALDYVGHGILVVAALIPGEATVEKGLEKGAVKLTEKIFEKEAINVERNLVENTAKNTTEKAAQKAEQLAKNVEQGKAAEQLVGKELVEEGKTVVGSRVSVNTSKGRRVLDHLTDTEGQLTNVEVKSGGATRNASQVAKDSAMSTEGGTLVGNKAPQELRGQNVKIQTEVRQVPKEKLNQ